MALSETQAKIIVEQIVLPKDSNVVFGQTHFIKSAEDLFEALAESAPGIRFGVAFCEASGVCLVRSEGNDEELREAAEENALRIGCSHSFIAFLRNAFPVNVLNRLKQVSEVCGIYCATANPVQVIIAETMQGRGVLGVIDGSSPKGVEDDEQREERRALLKKFGYKL